MLVGSLFGWRKHLVYVAVTEIQMALVAQNLELVMGS